MEFYICRYFRPYVFTILAFCTECHEIWYAHLTSVCHVKLHTVLARRKQSIYFVFRGDEP